MRLCESDRSGSDSERPLINDPSEPSTHGGLDDVIS